MAHTPWRAAFPHEEYLERIEKTKAWMRSENVDLILVHDPAHFCYLTGADNTAIFYYQVLLMTSDADKEPVFLTNRGDFNLILESCVLEDIRIYWNYHDHIEETLSVIREITGTKDYKLRIGMNLGKHSHYLKVCDYLALTEKMPNAEIVNCHTAIDDIRLVKSEKEVEYLRYSCLLSDAAFLVGCNHIHEGAMDRDVYAEIEKFLYSNGNEWRSFPTLIGGTGRSPDGSGPEEALHGTPVGRRLKNGDVLYLEISGNYKRYNTNLSRMVHVGKPSDKVVKAHELVRDNLLKGQEIMAPGVSTREVYDITNTYPGEWQKYARASIGFSNELAFPPIWMGSLRFDKVDEHVFEPGMVVCLEPGFSYFDGMTMELGNMILITETGHEVLNNAPLDLALR